MCVICVKEKGVAMPTTDNLKDMWIHNPDGAGFMYARNGKVFIRKGFMKFQDLFDAIKASNLTINDPVVFHFRISTQAGICKEMTHPFALSNRLEDMKELDVLTNIGIAHNGIIALTSNPMEKEYSDTAIFIARYLTRIIRKNDDINDEIIKDIIYNLAKSKFAIMNKNGDISMIGNFTRKPDGLYYSNLLHEISYHNYSYYHPVTYSKVSELTSKNYKK